MAMPWIFNVSATRLKKILPEGDRRGFGIECEIKGSVVVPATFAPRLIWRANLLDAISNIRFSHNSHYMGEDIQLAS